MTTSRTILLGTNGAEILALDETMNCVICKSGETKLGKTTASFTREQSIVIVKDIPAQVYGQCGEPYFDGDVAKGIEKLVNDAVRKGAEVEILRYAA